MSLTDLIPGVSTLKLVGVALGVALVVGTGSYWFGHHRGAVAERAAIEGQIAKRAAELLKERAQDDAELRTLSNRALCIELLADGVPVDACD